MNGVHRTAVHLEISCGRLNLLYCLAPLRDRIAASEQAAKMIQKLYGSECPTQPRGGSGERDWAVRLQAHGGQQFSADTNTGGHQYRSVTFPQLYLLFPYRTLGGW